MIVSFGHDHGAPSTASQVFDLRGLSHDTNSPAFLQSFRDIVEYGRANPHGTIAIGCEQGKHRSVVMANKVATALRVGVYHRDKGR